MFLFSFLPFLFFCFSFFFFFLSSTFFEIYKLYITILSSSQCGGLRSSC